MYIYIYIYLFIFIYIYICIHNARKLEENYKNSLYISGQPSEETIDILKKLHMSKLPLNKQDAIKKKATYIFAKHSDKDVHNCHQLSNIP